ncbi:MAG: PAS domain-containing protein [archaeon]|nr:PAS domain-containing protein [archaeon]
MMEEIKKRKSRIKDTVNNQKKEFEMKLKYRLTFYLILQVILGLIVTNLFWIYVLNQSSVDFSQYIGMSVLIWIGVIVFIIGCAYKMILDHLDPLTNLTKEVERIARGDYSDVREDLKGKDEVQKLVDSFLIMNHNIREQSALNRLIIDSTTAPLIHILNQKIHDVGDSFLKLTGFSREEYIGKAFNTFFEDPNELENATKEFMTNGQLSDFKFKLRNNLNNEIICHLSSTSMVSEDGKEMGQLNTIQDISIREKSIRKLDKSSSELFDAAKETKGLVEQIFEASNDIAVTSQHMASGTVVQSERLQVIVESVNGMIQKSSDIVKKTGELVLIAQKTNNLASSGETQTKEAVTTIETIMNTSAQSLKIMENLGEKSKQIGNIVDVITGIADRTNLLALNASIEAARAGEYGRGFAVVASEVGNLAENSKKAAQEITELIQKIQGDITKSIDSAKDGNSLSIKGKRVVESAADNLGQILEAVENTNLSIDHINEAIQVQNDSINNMMMDINEVSSVAEEASASSEEFSASAEELSIAMGELAAGAEEFGDISETLKKVSNTLNH